jgi:hypothetical protein
MKKRPAPPAKKKQAAKTKQAKKSDVKPKPKPKPKPRAGSRAPKPKRPPAAPPKPKPRPKRRQTRTVDKRRAFLAAFAVSASISGAAAAAKVDRGQHYDWLRTDPTYAPRFQEAKAQAAQAVDDEIVERAMRGVYEPNIFQGKFVYPQEEVITPAVIGPRGGVIEPECREWRDVPGALPLGVWKKSDTLLIHLSRGLMPEKYGFRGAMELTGAAGGPIEIVERLNRARARAAQRNAGE